MKSIYQYSFHLNILHYTLEKMFFRVPAIISIFMTSIEVLIEKTSYLSLTREKEVLPTSIRVACRAADVDLDAVGFISIKFNGFNKSTNWHKVSPIQDDIEQHHYIIHIQDEDEKYDVFANNTEYCDMV